MEATGTAVVTLGGLLLSLACTVLIEELCIGALFRLFFTGRPRADTAVNHRLRGAGVKKLGIALEPIPNKRSSQQSQ